MSKTKKPKITQKEHDFNYSCAIADFAYDDKPKTEEEKSFFIEEAKLSIKKMLDKYGIKEDTEVSKAMMAAYFLGSKEGRQR